MKPKMIWANFSVADVNRTKQFYTRLGFKPNKFNDYPQLASFLFGENEFVIHFFEKGSQIDEYLPAGTGSEIIFTLSAGTKEEVMTWAENVKTAGGSVIQEPQRDKKGYYGFMFADPDGHRFNVLLVEKGM